LLASVVKIDIISYTFIHSSLPRVLRKRKSGKCPTRLKSFQKIGIFRTFGYLNNLADKTDKEDLEKNQKKKKWRKIVIIVTVMILIIMV